MTKHFQLCVPCLIQAEEGERQTDRSKRETGGGKERDTCLGKRERQEKERRRDIERKRDRRKKGEEI